MKVTREELNEIQNVISEKISHYNITLSEKKKVQLLIDLLKNKGVYNIMEKHILSIQLSKEKYFNNKYLKLQIRIFDRVANCDKCVTTVTVYRLADGSIKSTSLKQFKNSIDSMTDNKTLEELNSELDLFIKDQEVLNENR